jgi:hypothetical protein
VACGGDAVGEAVAGAEGGAAVAERSHARTGVLLEAGRMGAAIAEIHRARMEWWSGDHVRPLAMTQLLLGDCYMRLNLLQAAKQYALGAVALASSTWQDDLTDLVPHGLLRASSHDYTAGNWCSVVQLADLGLHAQATMVDAEIDPWADADLKNTVMTIGMALRASRQAARRGLADGGVRRRRGGASGDARAARRTRCRRWCLVARGVVRGR